MCCLTYIYFEFYFSGCQFLTNIFSRFWSNFQKVKSDSRDGDSDSQCDRHRPSCGVSTYIGTTMRSLSKKVNVNIFLLWWTCTFRPFAWLGSPKVQNMKHIAKFGHSYGCPNVQTCYYYGSRLSGPKLCRQNVTMYNWFVHQIFHRKMWYFW